MSRILKRPMFRMGGSTENCRYYGWYETSDIMKQVE